MFAFLLELKHQMQKLRRHVGEWHFFVSKGVYAGVIGYGSASHVRCALKYSKVQAT
jgi:hypothetical protein